MSYLPQSAPNNHPQHRENRPAAPRPARRVPNDFRDYNHGPAPLNTDRDYPSYYFGRSGYAAEDARSFDQNNLRGGLGNAGSRDDFADRRFDQERNAFRGGYGGGDYDHDRPAEPLLDHIGMNSPGSADQSRPTEPPTNAPRYGRGWNDLDDHHDRGRQQ